MQRCTRSLLYDQSRLSSNKWTHNSLCFNSIEDQGESLYLEFMPAKASFCFLMARESESFVPCHSQPSPFCLFFPKISMMARESVSRKDPFRNCVPQTDKHGNLQLKGLS